jgi:DNA-binding response OmpR family regulator
MPKLWRRSNNVSLNHKDRKDLKEAALHQRASRSSWFSNGGFVSRILIVEDEPAIALALEDDLALEGHAVEAVGDGETAVRRAKEHAFDLILLDVMLPRRDGFEVCRELRRAGLSTPILILTAKAQEAEKVMGLDFGADDYMTKPYGRHELRARVRALLRRAAPQPGEVYRFGDIELDLGRAELRRSGAPVELTPLEFRLMAAFVKNRGRAFTRQQLLDEVWGTEVFITGRVVDNQILSLRRKIEPDPAKPRHIVSVRGIGYRFDG